MPTATMPARQSESELRNIVTETYSLGPDALMNAITSKLSVAFVPGKRAPRQVRPSLGQIWENRRTGRLVEITRLSEGLNGYPLIYAKHIDGLNLPSRATSATEWNRTYNYAG